MIYEQPAEMSLEEIESKLGSLIQPETITQLKSAVWKERLEGFFCLSVESFCAYLGCKKGWTHNPSPHLTQKEEEEDGTLDIHMA